MINCSVLYFRARGYACSAKAHDVVRLLHRVGQNATNCGLAVLSPEARNVSPSTCFSVQAILRLVPKH